MFVLGSGSDRRNKVTTRRISTLERSDSIKYVREMCMIQTMYELKNVYKRRERTEERA